MTGSFILRAIGLCAATFAIGGAAAIAADRAPKPNVVFILADDKCYEAMRIHH
jgi:hypothetical protein